MSFIAKGTCYVCGEQITYNALLVPSFAVGGERVPLCLDCVEFANPRRVARGLPAIKVWPGTYGPFNDELKFMFQGRVGWPVVGTPPELPPELSWREKPDQYHFIIGVYWAATMDGSEAEDTANFIGKVE